VGKTYAEKLADIEKRQASEPDRAEVLAVCTHPDCADQIIMATAFIWSGKPCVPCANERRKSGRFIPTPAYLAAKGEELRKTKAARWGWKQPYSISKLVCENVECNSEYPTYSGTTPYHICALCQKGRVFKTTAGFKHDGRTADSTFSSFCSDPPGTWTGAPTGKFPTPDDPMTPVKLTWPSGPYVDRLTAKLAKLPRDAVAACLSDNEMHKDCKRYTSLGSQVGKRCGGNGNVVGEDSPRYVSLGIAAAMDRGIPQDTAIRRWKEVSENPDGEEAYKRWLMSQPEVRPPIGKYEALILNKLKDKPAGTVGICLTTHEGANAACTNGTRYTTGVGDPCVVCGTKAFMASPLLARALDAGRTREEAVNRWKGLARMGDAARDAAYISWIRETPTPVGKLKAHWLKQQAELSAGRNIGVCAKLSNAGIVVDCGGWTNSEDSMGKGCHMCEGVFVDDALADAIDAGVDIDTACARRRMVTKEGFVTWAAEQITAAKSKSQLKEAIDTMVNSGVADVPAASPKKAEEETGTMATTKDTTGTAETIFTKVVATAKKDAGLASWRLAATQITAFSKPLLIAALTKDLNGDESYRAGLAKFFDSEIGDAVYRGIIGMALPAIPLDSEMRDNLAEEFRVSALERGGNVVASHIIGPLTQVLSVAIQQSSAIQALAANNKALPNPDDSAVKKINFADVPETVKK